MKAINNNTDKAIQHTKGEWKAIYGQFPIGTVTVNTVAENKRICSLEFYTINEKDEIEANAARIVKCVNSHDALIDALQDCLKEFPCYDMQKETVLLMDKIKALLKIAE